MALLTRLILIFTVGCFLCGVILIGQVYPFVVLLPALALVARRFYGRRGGG